MDKTTAVLKELQSILSDFENYSLSRDLRSRVLALVPAYDSLRTLGKSLIPNGLAISARDRLLAYFLTYPQTVLREKELAVVAGISEWARRVRELRVEFGWKIITGVTAFQMLKEIEVDRADLELDELAPNDYVLLDTKQDREAAFRWNIANDIRKGEGGGKEKILRYLRSNVGKEVSGEELSYVAQSSEWARRTRELRTEEGWPITTKQSGNPHLPIGIYVLEEDRQTPPHDRHIQESVRREALRRDKYMCRKCKWTHEMWNRSDPRFLELHHIVHHAVGGTNDLENLITYCNICHDEIHRLQDEIHRLQKDS